MPRAAASLAASVGLAIVVAALAAPSPCGAGSAAGAGREGIAAGKGPAGTIAELARMYDSAPCAACHREVYDAWRGSAHAASLFGGGRTADALRAAVVDGLMQWPHSGVKGDNDVTVRHLMGCAKCHLPQLADARDAVAREIVAAIGGWRAALDRGDQAAAGQEAGKLAALNVGCLICHNRNAVIHKWTDGYPGAGEIYGSREGTHPGGEFPVLKKSPILHEAILCGQCHGLGPNLELDNPTQCATSYGSYLYTYRAQGGTATCQDCHMRKGKLGHAMGTAADPRLLREALDVSADARGFQWRDGNRYVPRIAVEVAMTNKAGHALPGGGAAQKRLVLEVAAKTGGAEVFSRTKTYMPVAQRLGRSDRTGRGPYEKTGIVEDTALPAGRTVRERFDIVLEPPDPGPGTEKRPPLEVTVNVRLRLSDPGAAGGGATWFEATKVVKLDDVR